MPRKPSRLYLVHGEPGPLDALQALVQQELGWASSVPEHRQTIDL